MKRTAAEAFDGAAGVGSVFQPTGAALMDPKAYFQQWQGSPGSNASAPVPFLPASSSSAGTNQQLVDEIAGMSAVRVADKLKTSGQNWATVVQVEALHCMAKKSSFKSREQLIMHAHVRRLYNKVLEWSKKPPPGFDLPMLTKVVWSLSRFPDDVRGDMQILSRPALDLLSKEVGKPDWNPELASRLLSSMAKTRAITPHKALVSKVVAELVKDKGMQINQLKDDELVELLSAVGQSRLHQNAKVDATVRLESSDEMLFDLVGKRFQNNIEKVDAHLLCEVVIIHHTVGLRREKLFKAMCPRIIESKKDIREETMAKVIKAYTRFMIPLKEAPQGFRTMAVVAKGDFNRPSDKPKFNGPKVFDKPLALFPKTQVHSRC